MLKTKQIASRYIELLGSRGDSVMEFTSIRIQEVRRLLLQSLAPLHKKAWFLLTGVPRSGLTSRSLADEFDIGISHASNILSDLADYGLAEGVWSEQKGYSGYVWRVRE